MEDDSWHGGISDLMTGLMMIFLLIAISFMLTVQKSNEETKKENQAVKEIVATYSALQVGLYEDLLKEFEDDLQEWGATLEKDSTIRFNEPDILFEAGSDKINQEFALILDDFFPRYLSILITEKYINDIDEIRIEGHTSSVWTDAATEAEIYLNNSRLSQARAHSVLTYCYQLVRANHQWLHQRIRANGLSHGIPILNAQGDEDQARSRRVEFRVITKSQERILKIVEELEN